MQNNHHLLLATIAIALAAAGPAYSADPATGNAPATAAKATPIQVGSPAPAVKFGTFFKGEPVTALDPEKSYIIECWATWCGPCIAAFPHLTEIAKATEGKVTVIGVNVREKKTDAELQTFVKKQSDKMGYRVTGDTHGVIEKQWLEAAEAPGIPWAFVVVKGRIAWIGNAAALEKDTVLGLVEGRISIDVEAKAESERKALEQEIEAQVFGPLDKGDLKGAVAAAHALIAAKPIASLEGPMSFLIESYSVRDLPLTAVSAAVMETAITQQLAKPAEAASFLKNAKGGFDGRWARELDKCIAKYEAAAQRQADPAGKTGGDAR